MREHNKKTQRHRHNGDKEQHTRVGRHTQCIYRKGIKCSTHGHRVGDDKTVDNAQDKERDHQREAYTPKVLPDRAHLVTAEEVYHHQRGDGEQVKDMNTYRQTHKVGNKYYPAHRRRTVGVLLPLQHKPHHQRREHRREGIHLALDSRKPEGVGIGIRQRTNSTSTKHQHRLCHAQLVALTGKDTSREVRDSPEEEEDTEAAGDRVHRVNHHRHILGRGC